MNRNLSFKGVGSRHGQWRRRPLTGWRGLWPLLVALAFHPTTAQASIFQGETLDKVANALAWVVLFVAPAVGIAVFWIVHILPEKIAEKRKHPQAKAIQCLCLLSLVFGGLLWPLAWLWAYSKPVLHKLAYGTDQEDHGHEEKKPDAERSEDHGTGELKQLRERVAELEAKLSERSSDEGGRA